MLSFRKLSILTTTNQKIITGSINDISNNESVATLMGPTLIIIGEVVNHTMNIDPALLVQHVNA